MRTEKIKNEPAVTHVRSDWLKRDGWGCALSLSTLRSGLCLEKAVGRLRP